jgi:hypothetical protein
LNGVMKAASNHWMRLLGCAAKLPFVQRDYVRAFVAAVAGFLGIFVAVPIQREHVLAALPGAVLDLHADANVLHAIERRAGHFIAEAIPELQPVQRNSGRVDFVTEGVQRQSPDDGTFVGENMKTERVAFDGGSAEYADIHEFILVG